MKKTFSRKLLSIVSSVAILFNSLSAPLSVYAQEVTPGPTPAAVETPQVTSQPQETPIVEPSSSSEPSIEPSASSEPTVEPSVTPQVEETATPAPTQESQPTSNNSSNQSGEQSNTEGQTTQETSSPLASPEVTVVESEKGELHAVVLGNTKAEAVDEFDFTYTEEGSATLITDKADYAPTDTVVITGEGFEPNTEYELVITSDTGNFRFSDRVTSDESGGLFYSYQLDGTYRPNYKVEVKDNDYVAALTTFTDSDTGYKLPSTNLNSGWAHPERAYLSDNSRTEASSGDDIVEYYGFSFPDLTGSTINGIEIQIEGYATSGNPVRQANISLSWDGGSSWTTGSGVKTTDMPVGNQSVEATRTFGGVSDTWNRMWFPSDFTDFRVRLDTNTAGSGTHLYVDSLQVKVVYTPSSTPSPTPTPSSFPTPSPSPTPSGGLVCTNDVAGANDEPGQKDLTQMCLNYDGLTQTPSNIDITWNWDETGWSGNNSGDGCSLYDTDGDGLANYSLCAIVKGDPGVFDSQVLYSCGNGSAFKCTNPVVISSPTSSCSAGQSADDPFAAGKNYPNDTKASCNVNMSDVGGGSAFLIDVCSYPSQQPNSDPSDCIKYRPKAGKLEVKKVIDPTNDTGLFNLLIENEVLASNVSNGGTTGEVSLSEGTHVFSETAGTNTDLGLYTQGVECRDTNGTGAIVPVTGSGAGPYTISIPDGSDIVCTITNTLQQGTLTVIKHVIGGGASASDWTMHIQNATAGDVVTPFPGAESPGTDNSLVQGSYNVYETGGPVGGGYTLSYGPDCPSGNVTVTAGASSTCTLINTRDTGKIIVNKVIDPTSDSGKFDLYVNGVIEADDVGNPGSTGEVTVDTGTHSISEIAGTGTTLSDYDSTVYCGTDTPVAGTSLSQIQVDKGQTVTCTFINTLKRGSISGYKYEDADGDISTIGDRTVFEGWVMGLWQWVVDAFTNTGQTDTTDVNGYYSFENLLPGVYQIIEQPNINWVPISPASIITSLTAGQNSEDNNFVNFDKVDIEVCKKIDYDGDGQGDEDYLDGWQMILSKNGEVFDTQTTDDEIGCFTWYDLGPGSYSVREESKTGWTPTGGDSSYDFGQVQSGDSLSHTFVNFEYGQIKVCKYDDLDGDGSKDENEPGIYGVGMNLWKQGEGWGEVGSGQTDDDGCLTFTGLEYGNYKVGEEVPDDYYQTYPVNPGYYEDILVTSGYDNSLEPFVFLNARLASLGDFIWEDVNPDGIWVSGEPGIAGVDVNLYKDDGDGIFEPGGDDGALIGADTTDGTGSYLFENLVAGAYWVDVVDLTIPAGFSFTTTDPFFVASLSAGANYLDADFGLVAPEKEITLEKSNNKPAASAGDTVTYTLKVKNTGNITLNNIEVTDILPAGFSYIAGTASPSEPAVSGQILKWSITSMDANDEVLITYQAKIADDQKAAKYTNLAVCKADYGRGGDDEKFGGSIECNDGVPVSSDVSLGLSNDYGGNLVIGQVLGASTELPGTGNPTLVLIVVLALLAVGLILRGMGKIKFALFENLIKNLKKGIKLFVMLIALSLAILASDTKAVTTTVNISDLPEYTRNDSFDVSYTAISADPSTISAQFYYKKDGESYQTLGGAFSGPSDKIQVTGSQVNESGKKYYFKVVLSTGEWDETSITYDNSGPDAPGDFSKEKLGPTTYKIKWHSPNNDDFATVVIYRGEQIGFDANSSHEVARVGGEKDKNYEWVDNGVSPDKTYYYLLRALDKAGNSSGLVGDGAAITTTQTVTASPSAQGSQGEVVRLLPKEGEGQVLGEEATPEATLAPLASETPQGVVGKMVTFAKNRTKLTVLIIAVIAIAAYFIYKRYSSKRT